MRDINPALKAPVLFMTPIIPPSMKIKNHNIRYFNGAIHHSVNHISNAFFVLFNALIGIGDSNRLFDNAVGEIRKLNFDIELS